ncbi:hypothetical protein DOTSEDRAFT_27886 [Dothistroma septosporum NZE10]|uniref:Uncharacterized protein n=1 Tax=Dothistroma septosporum (strain NZE10 / CBS 128990) TaxID=675120 RepID=N1PCF6_DOTSN|nr:hypothetical protein DOTSEDRAFT_27886 [Dothistroma septosporum NZE10]
MQIPLQLLLCSFLTIAAARPGLPDVRLRVADGRSHAQRPLGVAHQSVPPPQRLDTAYVPGYPFDARKNSVGVVFANRDGELRHLWLPLGKRVFVRDAPQLPLHPWTARISTLINTSPMLASPEMLEKVVCEASTHGRRASRPRQIEFSKQDGCVAFADEEDRFWLGDVEVESYLCQ